MGSQNLRAAHWFCAEKKASAHPTIKNGEFSTSTWGKYCDCGTEVFKTSKLGSTSICLLVDMFVLHQEGFLRRSAGCKGYRIQPFPIWTWQPLGPLLKVKLLSQPCEAIKATLLLNLPLQESQHKSNTSTRVVLLKEGCKSLPTAVFRAKPWFLLLSQARCMSEMTLMNLQFDLHTSVKMQFGITYVSTKNSWEKQL